MRSGVFAARITTVMAGSRSGWSRAALFQLLLGVNLMVMPPTQARSLRFVTLVMGDGVTKGFANARRAKASLWMGGAGLLLGRGSRGGGKAGVRDA